jgi:hypothetical protein
MASFNDRIHSLQCRAVALQLLPGPGYKLQNWLGLALAHGMHAWESDHWGCFFHRARATSLVLLLHA